MNHQITSASYSVFTNKGAYALLLGSGISRASGIPTGWDITLQLIQQIAILENQLSPSDPEQWYKKQFGNEADYSDLLEKLTHTQEERLNLLRPFLEPTNEELDEGLKQPTAAHRYVAQLVRDGYIKVIVTTNFDRLLENALKEAGVEPTIISNSVHLENSIPLIHSKITIIKINGDYLDTTFLNTKSELENYDPLLLNNLKFIFENYGLITCGWSAKWDIALVNVLKAANKFRYGSYFCYVNEPDEELQNLASFRKGDLVPIKNADSFFRELSETVEALEKTNVQHPLTPQLVVQRLKKYIVKEEYHIELTDLCQEVFVDFEGRIKTIPLQGLPTNELILAVIYSFKVEPALLNSAVAHLSFYGRDTHYDILYRLIRQVALVAEQANSLPYPWRQLAYIPTLIIRYICGVSLTYRKKYDIINHIHKLTFKGNYREEVIMNVSKNYSVFDEDTQNFLGTSRSNLPVSEFLYKHIRPFFKQLIPVDEDYDHCFNYYEFIYSITYVRNDNLIDKSFPQGKFAYYDNRDIIGDEFENLQVLADQHDFIRLGLFSDTTTFEKALTGLSTFISNLHY